MSTASLRLSRSVILSSTLLCAGCASNAVIGQREGGTDAADRASPDAADVASIDAHDAMPMDTHDGLAPCTGTTVRCGANCVDTNTDAMNCGQCGTVCQGGALCVSGLCATPCGSGMHACSGMCVSNASIGSCGTSCTPCPVPPNAT